MTKKKPTLKEIKQACVWVYQTVGALADPEFQKEVISSHDAIKAMDILVSIVRGERIPHRRKWNLK
jgi:hypothetical protein